MAEGKKSFIAYSDWKDIFDELPDEDAGKLVKHIFAYVNDDNPQTDSVLIRAVFAQIKSTLKRDLDKWQNQLEQRREAGKASAAKRKTAKLNDRSTTVNERTRNSTVSDSVNVSDSVLLEKETKEKTFNFRTSLLDYGFKEQLVTDWLKVRRTKKATNSETAFTKFINQVELSKLDKNQILEVCIEKDWKSFNHTWKVDTEPKTVNNGVLPKSNYNPTG